MMLFSMLFLSLFGATQAAQPQNTVHGRLWDVVDQRFQFPDHGLSQVQVFDLEVVAAFVHDDETIHQALFYNGGDEWVLRFQASRRGVWRWSTQRGATPLHGLSGTIVVGDPVDGARGGMVALGNRFARQIDENTVEPVLYAPYMNDLKGTGFPPYGPPPGRDHDHLRNLTPELVDAYIEEAQAYGFQTIFARVYNYWFSWGALFHDEHDSIVPDLRTFEHLESILGKCRERGMFLHLFKWGKENEKQDTRGTAAGAGGINGPPDKRLQRYIAARMGPIPNWTMNYGIDLEEWIGEEAIEEWAAYMNDHMGWPHLLGARGRSAASLGYLSISNWLGDTASFPPPSTFSDVLRDMDPDRPSLYEERFLYLRQHSNWPRFTQETTRRHMWWYALAGGMGGFWGVAEWAGSSGRYPHPEQFLTHRLFWADRFQAGMHLDRTIAGGTEATGIAISNGNTVVVYIENADEVTVDLTGRTGKLHALAVDTADAYREIKLGPLPAGSQVVKLPYVSDWAIAIDDGVASTAQDKHPEKRQ